MMRNSSRPMLNSAGSDTASENSTRRHQTFNTLTSSSSQREQHKTSPDLATSTKNLQRTLSRHHAASENSTRRHQTFNTLTSSCSQREQHQTSPDLVTSTKTLQHSLTSSCSQREQHQTSPDLQHTLTSSRSQREQQRTYALRRLDQTQDSRDAKHSDDTKQGRIRWIDRRTVQLLSHLVKCQSWK